MMVQAKGLQHGLQKWQENHIDLMLGVQGTIRAYAPAKKH